MSTLQNNNNERVRSWIAAARQASAQGQFQEAERLLSQARSLAPSHPLVVNDMALRMVNAGEPGKALGLLDPVVAAKPADPEVWLTFAVALRQLKRPAEALEALEHMLKLDPRNVKALVEKATAEEELDRPRAAVITYRTLLSIIPPGMKTPQWMDAPLARARRAVAENNLALERHLEKELGALKAQFTNMRLNRFDRCVDILLQKSRVPRQQPGFMHYPELPAIEFYERQDFPWLDRLEAAADDIRAELLSVLSGEDVLDPYIRDPSGPFIDHWRELNHSRRWGVYFFWREGKSYPEHMARCPRTVEALGEWPRWDVPGSGPTAMFSILDAKTRIPPHAGPVNTRLVVHLPLIVPPGCGFRVGGQTRAWTPGQAFVFDDSIEHEAWNDSDVPRAVLIVDIWSPFLDYAERELIRALTARIGEFYGSLPNEFRD
jgi:aspartyl/asparaginyl beta-hydroxylase (cupin superfamily)/cytochrome c-type biogenesis protein CcmH/NrfG